MNQSPCVHISGQWKASSTRYRPPWWPLGGWASPKVLNWKTTTLLTQNYIWIISSVDQQYHVISRAHKHMPKCQQKNCSTGAIKSLNPLTMISTCFIWAGLICPLFLLSLALQSVRKALFTQTPHYRCNEGPSSHCLFTHREAREAWRYTSWPWHPCVFLLFFLICFLTIYLNMYLPTVCNHMDEVETALLPGADPIFLA